MDISLRVQILVALLCVVAHPHHCSSSFMQSARIESPQEVSDTLHKISKRGIITSGFPAVSIHPPSIGRPFYPYPTLLPLPVLRPHYPTVLGFGLRLPVFPTGLEPRSVSPPDLALLPPLSSYTGCVTTKRVPWTSRCCVSMSPLIMSSGLTYRHRGKSGPRPCVASSPRKVTCNGDHLPGSHSSHRSNA